SRYAITDAGIGSLIDRFRELAGPGDREPADLKWLGPAKRPEARTDLECVQQTIPPGKDPALPTRGQRGGVLDPANKLPTLVITQDASGHEVEYYCYDLIQPNIGLDDDDFDPAKLWKGRR